MTEADSPIQIDNSDRDSSYNDSDAASETSSLRSSIFKFVYENGRRYHSFRAGTYWGPNDEKAQDNLDLFHHIFTLSLDGKLFLAPISPKPQRVLDLGMTQTPRDADFIWRAKLNMQTGTGTGIWAMDFADDHPSASVIATDLSPIQPDFVPSNLEFQIDDFTAPWTFAPESFDFIHARSIYGCVADYPALYAKVYNALKPGAYFQQAEISVVPKSEDGSIAGTHMEQWGPLALEAGEKFGKSFRIAEDSKALIEQAGFVNVTYRRYKWPIGPWPKDPKLKEIGSFNRLGWEDGIEGWAMYLFTKYLGWRTEEIQVLIAGIRKELRDSAIHGYQEMQVFGLYVMGKDHPVS